MKQRNLCQRSCSKKNLLVSHLSGHVQYILALGDKKVFLVSNKNMGLCLYICNELRCFITMNKIGQH